MLQQDQPEDFVIATGQQISVREFVRRAAAELGITLEFSGSGVEEIGTVTAIDKAIADPEITTKIGDVIVRIDPQYYRPAEVQTLLGDPSKAKEKLGWVPRITLDEMIAEMIANDLTESKKQRHLKNHGFAVNVAHE